MQVDGKKYDCKSGRGAGGQFILMLPELDLIIVTTAHNKGHGQDPSQYIEALIARITSVVETGRNMITRNNEHALTTPPVVQFQ